MAGLGKGEGPPRSARLLHFFFFTLVCFHLLRCFRRCGFFPGLYAADDDQDTEGWGYLRSPASSQDFVTVDEKVANCGLRSIEKKVDEANEIEADSDDEGADMCDDLPSTSGNHHALDVL